MSDDGVNLASLRALGGKKGGQIALTKAEGRVLTRDKLARGRVIACDPSLGGCGLVTLIHDDRGLWIPRTARLVGHAPEGSKGMAKDTGEALDLRGKIQAYVEDDDYETGIDVFTSYEMIPRMVREAPPIGSPMLRAKESSIQAGLMFDVVAIDQGFRVTRLPMIYVASHRATICEGPSPKGMEKTDYHKQFLLPLAERLCISGMERVTNPDIRDALCVGLTALARGWE